MAQQLHHKAQFILDYVPDDVKVSIIGYSISCYLLLDLLKTENLKIRTVADTVDTKSKNIDTLYLIFPTIERMKHTPLGKFILPALVYFTWFILLLAGFLSMFPTVIKFPVIKRILTSSEGKPPQDQFITGAIQMIHPAMLKRVLNTLQEELEKVNELDLRTIEKNREKVVFYYGSYDPLCPKYFLYELKDKLPEVQAYLCQDELHHVYVTHTSAQMARIMKKIMGEQEKKAIQTTQSTN